MNEELAQLGKQMYKKEQMMTMTVSFQKKRP
jgi:hypothetical protein